MKFEQCELTPEGIICSSDAFAPDFLVTKDMILQISTDYGRQVYKWIIFITEVVSQPKIAYSFNTAFLYCVNYWKAQVDTKILKETLEVQHSILELKINQL